MLAQVCTRGFVPCFSLFRSSESLMRRIKRNIRLFYTKLFFGGFLKKKSFRIKDGSSETMRLAALTMQSKKQAVLCPALVRIRSALKLNG